MTAEFDAAGHRDHRQESVQHRTVLGDEATPPGEQAPSETGEVSEADDASGAGPTMRERST